MSSINLHIFFLPFLAPGHMIPMVDLARIFADRGAKSTIITTVANAPLIQPTIDRSGHGRIQLLTLPFPSSDSNLPENLTGLPTPDVTPNFLAAVHNLQDPFNQLLVDHHPDCIVSDIFYPWTADLATELGIPRLVFHGTGFFCTMTTVTISQLKPHETVADDNEPFVVPGIPHRIEMTRSQLPDFITAPDTDFGRSMGESYKRSYGMVMNSFYELEPEYCDIFKKDGSMRVWHVGPVSLFNRDIRERAVRGGEKASSDVVDCLNWLDHKQPGSVIYVCFGSLPQFTSTQLREIALGLEAAAHPFIWVVRNGGEVLEGFEERAVVVGERRGLIIREWAPQILILNHQAVGGFLTHCGWNSCLEGVSAGVPMITWPLFAEQFVNEKLMVDVLRIGIAIGVKVWSNRAEDRTAVQGEEVRTAVDQLMGSGEAAEQRRRRAREIGEMARRAVEVGGSSYDDMSRLIQDLMDQKTGRVGSG